MPQNAALYWLTLSCLATGLLFMPYVLNRIARLGLMAALGNPDAKDKPPEWAARAQSAHSNAVENLVVFAPLVLIALWLKSQPELVETAALVYFWARLVHYTVYTAGIPAIRTLAFFAGFGAQLAVAWAILTS